MSPRSPYTVRRGRDQYHEIIREARRQLVARLINEDNYYSKMPGGEVNYIDCVTHIQLVMCCSEQTARSYIRVILEQDRGYDLRVVDAPKPIGGKGKSGGRRIRYLRMADRSIVAQLHEAARPKLEDLL